MKKKLNILLLEDNKMNIKLLEKTLSPEFDSVQLNVIQTEDEFLLEIEKDYDIIISDYSMSRFDGMKALQIRNQRKPCLPFIIVTGSTDEKLAMECMKAGADDYVIKEHILGLGWAVNRALSMRETKRQQILAQRRAKTLNRLLYAFRLMNQLVTSEKDVLSLLQRTCDIAVDEGMARASWISYHDPARPGKWQWVQTGYAEDFQQKMQIFHDTKSLPACALPTVKNHEPNIIIRSAENCGNCPLFSQLQDKQQIVLPLQYDTFFYGVIAILVPDDISLTMEEANLFEEAASDIAYAINHILIEKEKVHAARIRSLIYDITQAALITEDLDQLLAKIHEILGNHLNVSNFYVAFYRADTNTYDFPYFRDAHDKVQSFKNVETSKGITDYVRRTAKPLLATVDVQNRLVDENEMIKVGHPSEVWMGVPLATKNGIFGVMALQNYEDAHAFTQEDLELLSFISGQVAMSIEKRDLLDRIAESESQFRAAFMVSPDSITISRLSDGKFVLVNKKFQELVGYTEKQILGKTSTQLKIWTRNEDREHFVQMLREKVSLYNFESVLKHKKGKLINVLVASKVLKLKGEPHVLSIIRDMTGRKKTEELIRLLSRSVEQSPVSVVITDVDGNITYVNKKFSGVTGYTSEEAVGQNPRILKSGKMPEKLYEDLWGTITKGLEWQGEILNKKKNGDFYWESVSISPVIDEQNKLTHFVAFKEDISERKLVEDQLKRAKEKAEESDQLKSEFLANLSHEIRTPMNGIIGFASLLEEDEDQSPESRANYVRIIINSTQQLLRIITDILEISKLETHQVPLYEREVNINTLLMETFSIFDLKAKQKKLALYLKKGLPDRAALIRIDDVKLLKVINNLLENAIKFTNKGYVELGYTLLGNELEFYVKDTGIGIRAEMKEVIFERFSQEEKELSRKVGGLGLGLSIAKANVNLMGGSIKVGSEKGKGSTFYIRVPYKPLYPDAITVQQNGGDKSADKDKNFTFLVVEDDEVNYQYLEILLKKMNPGFKILHAIDGKGAIDLCRDDPDICMVFMDIKMQGMSGLEATKIIKKSHPGLPIIVQSAYVTTDDQRLAKKAGCDAFIPKPTSVAEFYNVVNEFLKK